MEFKLNGNTISYAGDPEMSLMTYLRDEENIISPKDGCAPEGVCGCCTVLMDDNPLKACIAPMRRIEGKEIVEAKKSMMGEIIEISDEDETKIMENVYAITTPGHTNGHISFIVKTDNETVLIAGDQTMTKEEYCNRKFSRWYPEENFKQLNKSLDKAKNYKPDLVIPGHDRSFQTSN